MVPLTRNSRTRVTLFGRHGTCLAPLLAFLLFLWPGTSVPRVDPDAAPPAGNGKMDLQYARLETALERYRRIVESGGWPVVPEGPTIRPGARDSRSTTLARRLKTSGDLEDDGRDFDEYDDVLQAAVLRFQSRHGLDPDALVGRKTLRALNVSAGQRVNQIRQTLDRLRLGGISKVGEVCGSRASEP